jgi:hypothetical protein
MNRGRRVRQVNPERVARTRERNITGPYSDFDHSAYVRTLTCVLRDAFGYGSCFGMTEAAHIHARGMGGVKGTWEDQVPMCHKHHRWYDSSKDGCFNRPSVALEKTGIDLEEIAAKLAQSTKDRNAPGFVDGHGARRET